MTLVFTQRLSILRSADSMLAAIPHALPLLALRIALAVPFYRSGLTKWDGFLELSPSARLLFSQHFKLNIFGAAYAYPFPGLVAWVTAIAEIVLPVLLVLGLFTRFSALGILVMTGVIQLTVPDGWANFHLPWAAMALALATLGGGGLSADRFWGAAGTARGV